MSASPEEIVAPLARYLDVDGFLATRSSVDDAGRYTGTTDLYCYGPAKAVAMIELARQQGIDLDASFGYSDSATDIPMLECVGHAVAVNPDRELLRAARDHGWEVRLFTRRVRLRDRVPTPPPGPTTAVGGIVAAAVGGGAVWWWLRREPDRATKGGSSRQAAAATTRRGPSWLRQQRAQPARRESAASSWRRILERSPRPRSSGRPDSPGGVAGLTTRVRSHLPRAGGF